VGTVRRDGNRDNHYLSPGDVAGVALAGVKELTQQDQEMRKELQRVTGQNEELRRMVEELTQRISELERTR
jgi:phage shock protein A